MTKEDKLIRDQFQCEYNRVLEEEFAQLLAERNDLNLFFINENQAFTDGRSIIIDPAWNGLFADEQALKDTESFLMLDSTISGDRWLALRMSARAQNIHEALHIIYSNFPCAASEDVRATCKARCAVLSLIANIIEDAFIEAAGCSEYDNMERFLLWHRVALFYSNTPSQGTVQRALAEIQIPSEEDQSKAAAIVRYLNYMCIFLLYPMARQEHPDDDIEPYVTQTKHLYQDGAMCGDADKRYCYVQRIFDLVEPIIPQGEDAEIPTELLARMLSGSKTHAPFASSIIEWESKGRSIQIKRSLFKDEKGDSISFHELRQEIAGEMKVFSSQKEAALNILTYAGSCTNFAGIDFDCDLIHQGITIRVQKPRINLNMKTAYQNILNTYRLSISSYNARFSQLLKGTVDVKEDRQLFGSAITSKHLGDVKKRYWSRTSKGIGVPDISIMLLIDGSGSMGGDLREGAIVSSVVLHEVLRKNAIRHAIVEHRAFYGEPRLLHNILVDFDARAEEKYNLLSLEAEEGTREGLSLFWAEKYLKQHSDTPNKLIIMISDGQPAHWGGDADQYYPPLSARDTGRAAQKITRRGTQIIAIALDEPGYEDNYQALKAIYPSVVSCTDIKRLTGQLLGLISKGLA